MMESWHEELGKQIFDFHSATATIHDWGTSRMMLGHFVSTYKEMCSSNKMP